ncbi:5-oxoprolinase subunit PxpA [Microbacterium sp. X-17]|uniref:5-oxoprolinase subunit PxpA n=1 Tax=Microbacterium sp. X-17 TaxID=3144404 RepID=UPI0031F503C2
MRAIDLNADLGETVDGVPTADDEAMFALISSASVACGGHAGDAASMAASVERAARFGVAIGAHPSYPDRAGFGRSALRIEPAALSASIAEQLAALVGVGAEVRYVKPHGALYHAAGRDPLVARAVVRPVAALAERLGRPLPILALGDALRDAAREAGLPFIREAFLDRGYRADGALVPRGEPGDLLRDPDAVAAQALSLARDSRVTAVDGTVVETDAASLCLHGDSPGAVALGRAVRRALDDAGVPVRASW